MTDGTLRPDPEALLAHSGWVRALARSLVADATAAEDVEQETWRRALESPPKHAGNLRAWLATVVRSVAAQRGRSEGRATARHERFRRAADHESGAGPRQAPPQTPGEIAERMETFQALAEGIGKLQEPYASAIYLRFVEELSVAEVAKRQSVPVPTAATRIRRGLELLREQMRGRFGESWKARCLVFAPPATTAAVPPVIAGAIAMTTKTKFLAAAAVLALAIPVYSVLTAPGDLVEEGRDPAAVEAQLPSAPEPMSVVEAPAAGAAERSEVEASSATADTSTDPRALRVVVRDASTLEPVKDAVVWYFDRASEKDRDWNRDLFSRYEDTETLLERYGEASRTDGEGRVTLPPRKSYAYLGARAGEQWASTYLMEDPATDGGTEVELLLRPSVSFRVLVEDALGRPVPHQRVEYQEAFGDDFAQWLTPAMTDEQGIAHFRNLQDRLAEGNPNLIHRIAVPIPGGVVAHEFALSDPPAGQISLRLPATGSVRVKVRRPDGTPIPDGKAVQLQEHVAAAAEGDLPRRNAQRGTQMQWVRNGEARFERVALNTQLVAWIQGAGQREAVEVIGMGPIQPGQEVELLLGAPPEPTVAQLEVRDHQRALVTEGTFSLKQVVLAPGLDPDPISSRTSARSDGTVSFLQDRLLDESGPSPADARMMLVLLELAEGRGRWGVASWDIVAEAGAQKVGELVLGEQLICAGTVLGADGQPLPFAELDLRVPAPWPQGEDDQIWLNFKADAEGRFEVRGTGLADGVTLHGYVSPPQVGTANSGDATPVELAVGRSDLTVSLGTQARIAGRLLLDPEVRARLLHLRLEVTPMGEETSEHWIEIDQENGRFSRGSLPDGAAQLVLGGSGRLELFRSDWFELRSGEAIVPPGCDPLDLRGRIFVHRLQFQGPAGEQPERVSVMFPDEGVGTAGSGVMTLLTPSDQILASFEAPGYRSLPARVIRGDETIRLERGVPVRFRLPEGVTLPAGEWQLHLRKLPDDFGSGGADQRLEQTQPGVASWEAELPLAGTYMLGLVRAYNRSQAGEAAPPTPVLWAGGSPFTNIRVADQAERQTIVLELSQEQLDAAAD